MLFKVNSSGTPNAGGDSSSLGRSVNYDEKTLAAVRHCWKALRKCKTSIMQCWRRRQFFCFKWQCCNGNIKISDKDIKVLKRRSKRR